MKMKAERISKVIGYMKEARLTHVNWIEYLNQYPEYDPKTVGNQEHHQKWVNRYDETIDLLTYFLNSKTEAQEV